LTAARAGEGLFNAENGEKEKRERGEEK